MNEIQRQIFLYSLVGLSGICLDAVLYAFFLKFFGFPISIAKVISVIVSVIYGYVMNCCFTFSSKVAVRSIVAYCFVYGVSIIQNVATNSFLATHLPKQFYPLICSFLIATAISVCINFFGLKFFVFKK